MASLDQQAALPLHPGWTEAAPKPTAKPKAKNPTKPGPPAAVRPNARFAEDLRALFRQYANDPAFRDALAGLANKMLDDLGAEATSTTETAVDAFWHSLRNSAVVADFAMTWKLDRLPVIERARTNGRVRTQHFPQGHVTEDAFTRSTPPYRTGLEAVRAWLMTQFSKWASGERSIAEDALSFGGGIVFGGALPHVRELDAGGDPDALSERQNEATGKPEPVTFRLRLPRRSLPLRATYDPSAESRSDARARDLRALERAYDAIEAEYREAKYVFADVRHGREQHAGWLFRRLAYDRTYRAVADEWNLDKLSADMTDEEAVKKAVNRFAHRLGIRDLSAR